MTQTMLSTEDAHLMTRDVSTKYSIGSASRVLMGRSFVDALGLRATVTSG